MSTHGAAPIALEPYAGVAAELEAGRASSEVLEREGISPERWKDAERYWKPRIDEASGEADLEARTRYRALFAAKHRVALTRIERERASLARARPKAPDLSTLEAASAAFAAPLRAELPALESPEPPAVERRPPIASTSYDAAPAPAPTPPPARDGFAQPPPAPPPPQPFAPPRQPPLAASAPQARPASSPPTMALPLEALTPTPAMAPAPRRSATLAISLDAIPGAPVPFKPVDPKAPPAPPPPIQIADAPPPKRDLGATMMPDTEPAPRAATPFASSPRTKQDLGATIMPDTEPAPRPATPFVAPPRSPTPFPATPAAASPPAQAASPAPKRFAINVFASITAEIAEQPADVAAIRARYGITEAEHRAESERWTSEFERNDELRQRYLGIVSRYRSYLQQRKKG